ncbi:MAG TPA: haloacid dehalogenase-like hydrolase [Streptosporangiaceae bacterium]|nr:haloacid dehalogenase-like hydrolase [Streptosporangiaceae bacterium]
MSGVVPVFLVLWDVDFTLVNTRGAGIYLYQLAFTDLYGRSLPEAAAGANMAGRTDRAIALDVLALAGIPDPALEVFRFEAALARFAPGTACLVAKVGYAMPGAGAAIAALACVPGVRQSLLTGNVRAMARVKLEPFGLTEHLDLDAGAYGNESEVRADLVGLARTRAAAAAADDDGAGYSGQATVLVGDTPLDVEAALATGARAVGVATGQFSTDDLQAAGAHAVLPDLTDTGKVVAAVLGPAAEILGAR